MQKLLKEGIYLKKIAAQFNKDPSTISREVRKYAVSRDRQTWILF